MSFKEPVAVDRGDVYAMSVLRASDGPHYRYNPIFAIPAAQVDDKVSNDKHSHYHKMSLFGMLRYSGHTPDFLSRRFSPRPLEDIIQSSRRPVVVYPEGTTSNNVSLGQHA